MADREDDAPDERTGPTERSFGEPARLRRPTASEIAAAVEATPTVEGQRSPDIEVPSYLQKEVGSDRMVGTVGKAAEAVDRSAPGFTETPSDDPTIRALEPEAPREPASGPSPLVFVAAGLAIVAIALAMMLQ